MKSPRSKNLDYAVDAQVGNLLIEIRRDEGTARGLRASLVQLACAVAAQPGYEGCLILLDSKITKARLQEEWGLVSSVLKTDLTHRLRLYIKIGDRFSGIPQDPDPETQAILANAIAAEYPRRRSRGGQGQAAFIVLKILFHQAVTVGSPVTTEWLERTSGYSYPTVAAVLHSLGSLIERQPDRRLRLRWLPRKEFSRLIAAAGQARSTVRFIDRSGESHSPDYVRRLEKLAPPGLAIGGILGAKHYLPHLDIIGTPRLDLSLHCPNREMNLAFVTQLDPALKRVEDPLAPATLAVHAVRHAESLFVPRKAGLYWADSIECLLDLHEAGLELQENQFFYHIDLHVRDKESARKLSGENEHKGPAS